LLEENYEYGALATREKKRAGETKGKDRRGKLSRVFDLSEDKRRIIKVRKV